MATYDYHDENGALLFQVVRYEPKGFKRRRPDPNQPKKWIWSVEGVPQVPYRLPEIMKAISLKRVIAIVEGEKDADRLWSLGCPATCNAGGAGKWGPRHTEWFKGADIVVIPDIDPQKRNLKTGELMFHRDGRPVLPGQDHAEGVASALAAVAERVRYFDLESIWPAILKKGDISDWLDAGHTTDELYEIVEGLPERAQRSNGNGAESPDRGAPSIGELPKNIRLISRADFIEGFVPPEYLIAGVLNCRFVYAFTGQTGHAKTALALL